MPNITLCPRCGARILALQLSSGTRIELDATPRADGVWALVNGEPHVGVTFVPVPGKAPRAGGRLPRFKDAPLYGGHYGIRCAAAAAQKVDVRPKGRTGS